MILLLRPANGSLNAQKGMRLGSKAPWSPRAGGVIGFVSRVWILPFIFLDFVAPPAPPAKSAGVMHAERHYIKRDHKQTQGSPSPCLFLFFVGSLTAISALNFGEGGFLGSFWKAAI